MTKEASLLAIESGLLGVTGVLDLEEAIPW